MYMIGFVDLEFIIIPTYNCSITKNGGRNDNILKTINVLSNNSPSKLNKPEKIRLFIGFIQAIRLHKNKVKNPTK